MSDPGDVRRIFDQAIEVAPAEREPLLDRLCADRPSLRQEVERLGSEVARLDARLERLSFSRRPLSDRELDDEEHSERDPHPQTPPRCSNPPAPGPQPR